MALNVIKAFHKLILIWWPSYFIFIASYFLKCILFLSREKPNFSIAYPILRAADSRQSPNIDYLNENLH